MAMSKQLLYSMSSSPGVFSSLIISSILRIVMAASVANCCEQHDTRQFHVVCISAQQMTLAAGGCRRCRACITLILLSAGSKTPAAMLSRKTPSARSSPYKARSRFSGLTCCKARRQGHLQELKCKRTTPRRSDTPVPCNGRLSAAQQAQSHPSPHLLPASLG